MPKGYWVVLVDVKDPEAYQTYRTNVGAPVEAFGGKFVVRAGAQEVVEGSARPRCVVIEFPSVKAAKDCYASPAYSAARDLRLAAAEADFVIVEGTED